MSGTLYKLDFASGKSYVGVTNNFRRRLCEHRKYAERGHDSLLYRAWRKYGAPTASALGVFEDHYLMDAEKAAVAAFRTQSPHGYNMTPGGESPPTLVPEIAKRIGAKNKGKKRTADFCRRLSELNVGKTLSAETKRKLSIASTGNKNCIGRKASAETREKIGAAHRGKKRNPDAVAKTAAANRGRPRPDICGDNCIMRRPGVAEKWALANRGRKMSDESKAKIGNAHRGKILSAETRKKISDSKIGRPSYHRRGKKHSEESIQKMRESHRRRFTPTL